MAYTIKGVSALLKEGRGGCRSKQRLDIGRGERAGRAAHRVGGGRGDDGGQPSAAAAARPEAVDHNAACRNARPAQAAEIETWLEDLEQARRSSQHLKAAN